MDYLIFFFFYLKKQNKRDPGYPTSHAVSISCDISNPVHFILLVKVDIIRQEPKESDPPSTLFSLSLCRYDVSSYII